MILPAAALFRLRLSLFDSPASAILIFSKYCFNLVNSRKTGCSLAFTPLSRRKAMNSVTESIPNWRKNFVYKR